MTHAQTSSPTSFPVSSFPDEPVPPSGRAPRPTTAFPPFPPVSLRFPAGPPHGFPPASPRFPPDPPRRPGAGRTPRRRPAPPDRRPRNPLRPSPRGTGLCPGWRRAGKIAG
ncbi:hypothetical protein DR950_09685 [Kitasatospora xanthocidica]|uniref:Uncharacterized protein n=1 Tax=Kitasatospora xanthocidica TaxID=83382 RepID=A0A372ZQ94_9ACTN|nr:hypothetical protein DR950_09685 [Kitasatospora xanthocidica]